MGILMTPVVNCNIINFPNSGNEMIIKNEDGSYTILINAKLSDRGQVLAYKHALKHIVNEDFEKENVQEIERHAHME